MAICMKTTIDIADSLFKEIKQIAREQNVTFKYLVESSLRKYLKSGKRKKKGFKLKKHPFCGKGLVKGLLDDDWMEIRKRAYEGHGG